MGFLIYKRTNDGESVRYQRLGPLKLGGTGGLLARHVKSLPVEATVSWELETSGLLRLAGATDDNLTVLFDVCGNTAAAVCLYELMRIRGSFRETSTTFALDFNVALERERDASSVDFTAAFQIPLGSPPKKFAETLSITGGPQGGDWKWAKPALQLGATLVQACQGYRICASRGSDRMAA